MKFDHHNWSMSVWFWHQLTRLEKVTFINRNFIVGRVVVDYAGLYYKELCK